MNERSKKLAREVRKWLASPKGKESIKKSLRDAKESNRRFKESMQIDPKILKEPFTI